jgi:cellulose biosynthesis protein BcsQ
MDCPPALNLLTVNGLVAADRVIIPMQCEYYALEGLTDLVATLKKVRAKLNPVAREIEGLLRTMFDARSTLTQQVSRELESHFGEKVYRTIIPRNVRLAEAPSYGKPAIAFDRSSSRVRRPICSWRWRFSIGMPVRSAPDRSRSEHNDEAERAGPRPRRLAGGQ